MKYACIIGSLNADLVTETDRFPKPGETVTGNSFSTYNGGKGGNQTVALARLGAATAHIGKIGNDALGTDYLNFLKSLRTDTAGIEITKDCSTGTATIEVQRGGENRIIVVPGANGLVTPDFIISRKKIIENASLILLQLEIPLESVMAAAEIAHGVNIPVILDPAPAQLLPMKLLQMINYITPNETEASVLTGIEVNSPETARKAGEQLIGKGIENVIIKAGSKGAFLVTKESFRHIPGYKVQVKDTTAAGDSFNAGLAYSLMNGSGISNSIKFANAVAAISTTQNGAQTAMPTFEETDNFIRKNRNNEVIGGN